MFNTVKQIFEPKNKDLQKRILFTLAILIVYKIGTYVIVPTSLGDEILKRLKELSFLELFDAVGGGSLSNFSIFALGVSPYISASIIIQILQMDIIPYFTELREQGEVGRRKINQITRYAGIVIAFIQAFAFSYSILGIKDPLEVARLSLILTAGTSFLLWLGDQVTSKGVGNGISLIIMAGIVTSLPSMFLHIFDTVMVYTSVQTTLFGIAKFLLFILVYLIIIVGVVFVQEAERKIPVQYANKSNSKYGNGQGAFLPFKLNSAGVMPVIFASILLTIPQMIAKFIDKPGSGFDEFVKNFLNYENPVGFVLYLILIFGFSYIYTFMQMKPKELSENLQKNGGFIPGIRPGNDTTEYIKKVLIRVTVIGALFLMVVAAIPILFGKISSFKDSNVTLGGTGLLIIVGVALEVYRQIESTLVSRNYRKR